MIQAPLQISAMAVESMSPVAMVARIVKFRYLLRQLVWKSIMGTYGGSMGGLLWIALKPLLMLTVYTFVFGVIFHARFFKNSGQADPIEFALALFVGLSIFTIFSEMISKAPTLIQGNANFVKKVVFPLDMFVVAEFMATLFHYLISVAILLVFMLLHYGSLDRTAIFLPIIVLPFMMLTLGLSWLLAALGVYLRDIAQVTGILISLLMFLSPIFFPVSSLPEVVRPYIWLNPVSYVVEAARNALFTETIPELPPLLAQYLVGSLTMWLGFACFQKIRKGFADVL